MSTLPSPSDRVRHVVTTLTAEISAAKTVVPRREAPLRPARPNDSPTTHGQVSKRCRPRPLPATRNGRHMTRHSRSTVQHDDD
jgi:hypothetical protein